MIRALKKKKVRVPVGFATTAEAYWRFLQENSAAIDRRQFVASTLTLGNS
jgi:phosphoenolpyruvate synthase/pyruvate phosphate dikinase